MRRNQCGISTDGFTFVDANGFQSQRNGPSAKGPRRGRREGAFVPIDRSNNSPARKRFPLGDKKSYSVGSKINEQVICMILFYRNGTTRPDQTLSALRLDDGSCPPTGRQGTPHAQVL
jgi:hypothetical protein